MEIHRYEKWFTRIITTHTVWFEDDVMMFQCDEIIAWRIVKMALTSANKIKISKITISKITISTS